MVQVADQGESLVGASAHVGVEVLDAPLGTLLLGVHERDIGVAEVALGTRVRRIDGDADVGAHEDIDVVVSNREAERILDLRHKARRRSSVATSSPMTTNSSLPVRATLAWSPKACVSRRPTATRTASPVSCPCVSLMTVKSSRSNATTMTDRPCSAARRRARSTRSRSQRTVRKAGQTRHAGRRRRGRLRRVCVR